MKKLLISLLAVSVVALLSSFAPKAAAFDINNSNNNTVCSSVYGSSNTSYCTQTSNGGANRLYGPNGILVKAANLLSIVAGIASVIIIIIAGIQFALSSGDSQRVSKARTAVIYALVGIIIILAAQSIIKLVLDKIG